MRNHKQSGKKSKPTRFIPENRQGSKPGGSVIEGKRIQQGIGRESGSRETGRGSDRNQVVVWGKLTVMQKAIWQGREGVDWYHTEGLTRERAAGRGNQVKENE